MGQIVTWSVRDETLHCNSMIRIFKEFIKENPEIWTPKLKKELYEACRTIICLLYTSPSPRDRTRSRMPSSA